MNKKLVLAAALVFGVAGLMLGQTVKAQDANSASDNSSMNTTTTDAGTTTSTTDNSATNTATQ